MKIRHALVTATIVSALVATPAFAQADNTNSRWSPTVFDAYMRHDQSYNPGGDSTYAYSAGPTYVYGGPVYYYTAPNGYYYEQRPLVIGRMDRDLVYGPTPNQVRPGTSLSNPSGTELQGQNSGGK